MGAGFLRDTPEIDGAEGTRGTRMRKGHPTDATIAAAFGRRCRLALAIRQAEEQSAVRQADVRRELASVVGREVSDTTMSRWFNGHFTPAEPSVALALAKVLRVDVGWLLFGDYTTAEGPQLDTVTALLSKRG